MRERLNYAKLAATSLGLQFLLWLDQGLNVLLGLKAIVMALATGKEQAECYADETLSAHAYRSYRAKKLWGRLFMPPIDFVFALWQKPDPEITYPGTNVPITGHCERAFHKEVRRRGLPRAYSEQADLFPADEVRPKTQ
jgi:hypothetical protein